MSKRAFLLVDLKILRAIYNLSMWSKVDIGKLKDIADRIYADIGEADNASDQKQIDDFTGDGPILHNTGPVGKSQRDPFGASEAVEISPGIFRRGGGE